MPQPIKTRLTPSLKKIDSKTAEKQATSVIANKSASHSGTVRLVTEEGGRPLPLTSGSSAQNTVRNSILSTSDMVQVQINTGQK